MSDTKIEWAQKVWNPVTGCTKISPGCQNCYAERMAKRLRGRHGYPADNPFRVTLHPERLDEPLHWRKPRLVFVCSMGDLGHEDIVGIQYNPDNPYNPNEPVDEDGCKRMDFVVKIIQTISRCYWHTFIILTKRLEGLKFLLECAKENGDYWPQTPKQVAPGIIFNRRDDFLPNLWLGVTCENQEQADKRIPVLLQIPAAVRFVSVEPMLGAVDLRLNERWCTYGDEEHHDDCETKADHLHLVICGGESGPKARPMNPDWARNVRDDCIKAGVSFFFKQFGEWGPNWRVKQGYCKAVNVSDDPDNGLFMYKVGKKAAGRELDGKIYNQLPGV